jgi:DNA polymerase IV
MTSERTILHADMDAFYASVEQRDDPDLRGKPLVVGGPARRGVVSAASYEARRFGIHSAMPMAQALRRCAQLIVVPPRMETYAEISRRVFAILESYSPLVEPLSLDEAFVDLTGTERLHGAAASVAAAIKRRVREELELVVSVGVGPSKLIAKIASDIGKPDGLVIVAADEVRPFLHPLPVGRLFGVGKVTEEKLHDLGVRTIGQLAAQPRELLQARLGSVGGDLWQLATGRDERPVVVERAPESIGQEDTFAHDLDDLEELGRCVQGQADRVAHRLRAEGYQAQVVVVKIRTSDFKLRSKRRTLARPTSDGNVIGQLARELLGKLLRDRGAVRLTGVTAASLIPVAGPQQLSFPEPPREQGERLGQALDEIASKFGKRALVRAASLTAKDARAFSADGGVGRGEHEELRRRREVTEEQSDVRRTGEGEGED